MKEKIQKLAASLASAATLLKEEKTDEAAAALGRIAEETEALAADAEAAEAASAEKDATIEKMSAESEAKTAEIKKYADLYVGASDLKALVDELASVKSLVSETVGIAKASSTKDDVAAIGARLDAIEKAASSKQIQDERRSSMAKSAGISGLDLTPGA